MNNDFKDILLGRRSVKVYDKNVKISNEELLKMIEEATSAPSSVNFQPWKFVVVNTEEGKKKLRPHVTFNTEQNDTSSAMIVVLADLKPQKSAEKIYDKAVEKGYMSKEVKEKLFPMYTKMYDSFSKKQMIEVVKIDASLASMQLMLVARSHGYATNAIGGFDSEGVLNMLGLSKNEYCTVMLISIGKAAKEGRPSVRRDVRDIVTFL
ncbi:MULTISPECIES: nitroreductase family protein [unclassified Gemella]|uniref:nitroreductase family protein n=1 Tax=unclassified Gemella TaxID=2624949 RepID=UPI0010731657|nr:MULTISPECIES: nitroreductase family protein [unclassified Gemella]MBF0710248.1 nitroreductase family protein [Gemella sp. GL1.1]MBF0746324.1 nitroreductase family protein [Gemella sp. 19428wG2_WT2a]NYS27592.1 nitroreductase family protein [Gemella sp. GL1]TFU60600.1 nitroreductase family protein [Gemella sp. WT2a]